MGPYSYFPTEWEHSLKINPNLSLVHLLQLTTGNFSLKIHSFVRQWTRYINEYVPLFKQINCTQFSINLFLRKHRYGVSMITICSYFFIPPLFILWPFIKCPLWHNQICYRVIKGLQLDHWTACIAQYTVTQINVMYFSWMAKIHPFLTSYNKNPSVGIFC